MKHANIMWRCWLDEEDIRYKQVDFVHDEWQTEAYTWEEAKAIGRIQCDAIVVAGRELGLKCPLAGQSNIGLTWRHTH